MKLSGKLILFSAGLVTMTGMTMAFFVYLLVANDWADTVCAIPLRNQMLAVSLLGIGVAIGLSCWLARYFTRPIRTLVERASNIASGNVAACAQISREGLARRQASPRSDELGLLMDAFDRMVVALHTTMLAEIQATQEAKQAQDAADLANRTKSEFLANMSHEIRTPMNAIIGLTDLALRQEPSPKIQSYLAKVIRSSRSLLRIIDDILDLSRVEVGKLELDNSLFFIRDLFDSVVSLFGVRTFEKNIELIVNYSQECRYPLYGDFGRLEQVLNNLLHNALKFTDQGEIEIQVTTIEAAAAQVTLLFSVRDTGVGIPQEKINAIFEPFNQGDMSISRQQGGSGLGLAISRQLVAMMGGQIGVDSTPGHGTTFHFTACFQCKEENMTAEMAPPPDLGPLNVLVVDDNAASRRSILKLFEIFNFAASGADSGAAAVTAVEQAMAHDHPFDLVLVDLCMPDLDGIGIIAHMQAILPRGRMPRTILLTPAVADQGIAARGDAVGVNGYLPKPINCSLLFDVIMTVFGKKNTKPRRPDQDDVDWTRLMAQIGGARVLLVEDNTLNRQVAQEILEEAGLVVEWAKNGWEALQRVDSSTYDVILMDVQMPVLNGYATTRLLRAQPRFANLPIFAMTAHAMAGDKEKSLAAGMNGHIVKPIVKKELFAALLQTIPQREGRVPPPQPVSPVTTDDGAHNILDTLPGIDVLAALERINGNWGLFRSLLVEFHRYCAHATEILHALLARQDQDGHRAAGRMLHTIRGMAGNIAADTLFHAAQLLSMEISRGPQEGWPPSLEIFNQALQQVMMGIAAWMAAVAAIHQVEETTTPVPLPASLNRERVFSIMSALDGLLDLSDAKSWEVFERLKATLSGASVAQAGLQAMEESLARCDFATTRQLLLELTETMDVSWEPVS
ncbi:MAG: response regulator [Magnetococcales bacterium]|nr:response regulator [Magnetococcales bacterium]